MVNLLPEEMKKGVKENKGFEVEKEKSKGKKNIEMTTAIKDKPLKKEKKTRVSRSKPWGFIFKKKEKKEKKKKEKVILETSVEKISSSESENKNKEKEDISKGFEVSLMPEEMKKGAEENKGLEVEEKSKETKNIEMTTVPKDEPIEKENKKKEKVILETPVKKISSSESENKDKGKEDVSKDFEVSLMPQQTMIISRVIRSRLLFLIISIVAISTVFFISRLYGNWHFSELESEVGYLKREIVLMEAQTTPLLEERDNIMALADKATEVKRALDNHVYWSNFFDLLETHTVPDVYFGDFIASAGDSVQLMATSRNLMSLAQQIVAFNNAQNFVKEVDISNIQVSVEGAKALFNLILVDGIWQK